MKEYRLTDWLPTTRKEWNFAGGMSWTLFCSAVMSMWIIRHSGQPSSGASSKRKVCVWRLYPNPTGEMTYGISRKLGRPRLFFGVSAGCMDSMVNKYTANKRLRSDDAYTPDARPDMRPEYPSIVYTQILKKLYPDVPCSYWAASKQACAG